MDVMIFSILIILLITFNIILSLLVIIKSYYLFPLKKGYFLATDEVVVTYGKTNNNLKIIEYSEKPIYVNSGEYKSISKKDLRLKYKKHRFRFKDYNSIHLELSLTLQFTDSEVIVNKLLLHHSWRKMEEIIYELLENEVIRMQENIYKNYSRSEFITRKPEIEKTLSDQLEKVIEDKTGYKLADLKLFELN